MKRSARFQQTLASQSSFAKYGRKSKRELFLDQMNQVVPWSDLLALVEPVYPKAGNGRQPVGLAIMLRTYFLQQWFGLSDPGMRRKRPAAAPLFLTENRFTSKKPPAVESPLQNHAPAQRFLRGVAVKVSGGPESGESSVEIF